MIPTQECVYSMLGNKSILNISDKIAFVCSRQIPAETILLCYDWAIKARDAGYCVISGFHSPIEKDVLHYLLKGKQPIIMVLSRSLKKHWEPRIMDAIEEGRLLVISPFTDTTTRSNVKTGKIRNDLILKIANEIVVGYASATGQLTQQLKLSDKPIHYLSPPLTPNTPPTHLSTPQSL